MRWVLAALLLSTGCSTAIERRAIFDCRRIDTAFCCTSRVRTLCAEQCKDVLCGVPGVPDFSAQDGRARQGFQSNFKTGTDPRSHFETFVQQPSGSTQFGSGFGFGSSGPHDGQAQIARSSVDVVPAPVPPPLPVQFTSVPPVIVTQPPFTGFPTLIPFEPNIDGGSFVARSPEDATPPPFVHSTVIKSINHRARTTPDPRIIKPPDSLVVIGDYDEDSLLDKENLKETVVETEEEASETVPQKISGKQGVMMPKSSISEEALIDAKQKRGESSGWRQTPSKGWSVKIVPVQKVKSWPEGVETLPKFAVDGIVAGREKPDSGSVIRTFSVGPSKVNMMVPSNVDFIEPKVLEFITPTRTTQMPIRPSLSPRYLKSGPSEPKSSFVGRPATMQKALKPQPPNLVPQCGIAPEFTPCVSSQEASHALLDCCRRKNLPPGCLALCRYDITQTEVRSAMDRGLCGIFSVAPYLECASQGKDNSECCRHRGIVAKTGPQCEQFCRPTKGLTPLGIQHIVCANAIGDMLHCHHSGIRLRH
ncbi:unnamed protein product [Cylicocyclus nassatus]|uniref:Domain of unknown function DB domain-containing protein n=1 Tax=Cylicocyclus nassatus TaxID=53992 RepID=A0AA36GZN1_CYLNA|nr:unnamed protein product [Cylicocyclus nassatus]